MAGFTTVRNLGGITSLNLRDAVNAGYIPGPAFMRRGRRLLPLVVTVIRPTV
ncbi:MAG: hypothetical protein CM15mP74_33730 [Halieaceae bacterium]|nr:MAG: hypothetical protein CM15mP74_33730 [Halieaceae bacterium]